jgi:hypothetical protein
MVPALKSSGWLATTNCIEGPGASGGSRFLPIRFVEGFGSLRDLGDAMSNSQKTRGNKKCYAKVTLLRWKSGKETGRRLMCPGGELWMKIYETLVTTE